MSSVVTLAAPQFFAISLALLLVADSCMHVAHKRIVEPTLTHRIIAACVRSTICFQTVSGHLFVSRILIDSTCVLSLFYIVVSMVGWRPIVRRVLTPCYLDAQVGRVAWWWLVVLGLI